MTSRAPAELVPAEGSRSASPALSLSLIPEGGGEDLISIGEDETILTQRQRVRSSPKVLQAILSGGNDCTRLSTEAKQYSQEGTLSLLYTCAFQGEQDDKTVSQEGSVGRGDERVRRKQER